MLRPADLSAVSRQATDLHVASTYADHIDEPRPPVSTDRCRLWLKHSDLWPSKTFDVGVALGRDLLPQQPPRLPAILSQRPTGDGADSSSAGSQNALALFELGSGDESGCMEILAAPRIACSLPQRPARIAATARLGSLARLTGWSSASSHGGHCPFMPLMWLNVHRCALAGLDLIPPRRRERAAACGAGRAYELIAACRAVRAAGNNVRVALARSQWRQSGWPRSRRSDCLRADARGRARWPTRSAAGTSPGRSRSSGGAATGWPCVGATGRSDRLPCVRAGAPASSSTARIRARPPSAPDNWPARDSLRGAGAPRAAGHRARLCSVRARRAGGCRCAARRRAVGTPAALDTHYRDGGAAQPGSKTPAAAAAGTRGAGRFRLGRRHPRRCFDRCCPRRWSTLPRLHHRDRHARFRRAPGKAVWQRFHAKTGLRARPLPVSGLQLQRIRCPATGRPIDRERPDAAGVACQPHGLHGPTREPFSLTRQRVGRLRRGTARTAHGRWRPLPPQKGAAWADESLGARWPAHRL